jgi:proline racemase/trans-L-3-hydroxyproline dehydratase
MITVTNPVSTGSSLAGATGTTRREARVFTTVDYHTAGEPFRIVTGGVPPIPGATVLDRRAAAMSGPADRVRALLCNEPRGHADMYGCLLVPPDDDQAVLGALFWHKDGFSTACGHGTIALGAYAVDAGLVDAPDDGVVDVVIDVPSGRVTARVERAAGRTRSVAFHNVAAYPLARAVMITTRRGEITVDLAYGGAIYACARAGDLDLAVTAEHLPSLVAIGREVRDRLNATPAANHPTEPRLSGVYGIIWYDELGTTRDGPHQRNCTVFADGEVDRSPCGSGTSARLALLHADGALAAGAVLRHDSVIGTTFLGRVTEPTTVGSRPAVLTEVRGNAFRTGTHTFTLDPHDPLAEGFQLR